MAGVRRLCSIGGEPGSIPWLPAAQVRVVLTGRWPGTTLVSIAYREWSMMGNFLARRSYVGAAVLGLLAALLVAWVNLAVGIIGEPDNPANLMYAGVVAVALVGTLVARFRPAGLARTMAVAALAQVLVALATFLTGLGYPPTPRASLLLFNAILLGLWLGSAALFRRASRKRAAGRNAGSGPRPRARGA